MVIKAIQNIKICTYRVLFLAKRKGMLIAAPVAIIPKTEPRPKVNVNNNPSITELILPITPDAGALQALGVELSTVGWATAVSGRVQLGNSWANIDVGEVTTEHELVERGIYHFIRHPIYAGDLLLLLGFELALNSWLVLGVLLLTPVVVVQARREERTLEANLPGYREYRDSTKGFVPLVF